MNYEKATEMIFNYIKNNFYDTVFPTELFQDNNYSQKNLPVAQLPNQPVTIFEEQCRHKGNSQKHQGNNCHATYSYLLHFAVS